MVQNKDKGKNHVKKPIDFEFTTNGNKVSLTFDKKSINTANISYGIDYADGDETYDKFDISLNKDKDPIEGVVQYCVSKTCRYTPENNL